MSTVLLSDGGATPWLFPHPIGLLGELRISNKVGTHTDIMRMNKCRTDDDDDANDDRTSYTIVELMRMIMLPVCSRTDDHRASYIDVQ